MTKEVPGYARESESSLCRDFQFEYFDDIGIWNEFYQFHMIILKKYAQHFNMKDFGKYWEDHSAQTFFKDFICWFLPLRIVENIDNLAF